MGLFKKKPQPEATSIEVHSKRTDASNMTGLGGEIMETLKEHGIEPGKPQVIDASSIPGMSEEIMTALNQSGVWQQAFGAMAGVQPEHDDDPVEQLGKLAELHKKGVLSDYEFA